MAEQRTLKIIRPGLPCPFQWDVGQPPVRHFQLFLSVKDMQPEDSMISKFYTLKDLLEDEMSLDVKKAPSDFRLTKRCSFLDKNLRDQL